MAMSVEDMVYELSEDGDSTDVVDFVNSLYESNDIFELFETGSFKYKGYILTISVEKDIN